MADQIVARFSEKGIRFVRIALVDSSNLVRIRIIPIAKFLKCINSAARGFCMANAALGMMRHVDQFPAGLPPAISCRGEVCMVPDVTSGIDKLCRLPYGSGAHALCMVDLEEKDNPGVPFGGCARSSLKKILRTATDEFGLSFLVGFEIEVFFLEKSLDSITPIDYTTYASSVALRSERTAKMIDEIAQSISDQGIEILHFHAESGPGQFEFVTDPYDPLTAADNLVRTRETIYNIAEKYGIKATLAPKVFADHAGSGAHCNISIDKFPKLNVTNTGPNAPEGINSFEESFLAGILKHLSSICAFTLPNVTSYSRTQEHCWAGCYVCWGIDNREATLRLAYIPGVNRKYRFEVKNVDGTSNPYLAVSAIIVAGLDGIRRKLHLEQKEVTGAPNPLELKRMPCSIEEALSNLEEPTEYELFCEGMNKTMVDLFIAVRKGEVKHVRQLSDEEQLKFAIKHF
ncbi:protein fluG-like [Bradysia coprophila]|uniref:protein fluG-like n=1 Tax=Bradysia coprophila TaxID=38358 RepID=UPI00187D9896|nr:protein fluG-like [Bradysia coprophila]XP_037045306.1 protein fluG-like [Bradysia coprophila]XP_037045308.1 protein fluG-like [Bradysia coprophila]